LREPKLVWRGKKIRERPLCETEQTLAILARASKAYRIRSRRWPKHTGSGAIKMAFIELSLLSEGGFHSDILQFIHI